MNIERTYKEIIEADLNANNESAQKVFEYLDNSSAKYKEKTIYSLYMAKLFPQDTIDYLKKNVEIMYEILKKVMNEYRNDENYRKLFGFSEKLESLILNIPNYENILPICRLDIFLNEDDLSFKFCEFNADGTSSMNEDRELNIAFKLTKVYEELEKRYTIKSFELFDSWAKEFGKIYKTYTEKVNKPHIAIVDFLEKGCSLYEFEEFKNAFERAGYSAEICEIRKLNYDGKYLYSENGKIIDAIYRRAVTSDIVEKWDEVFAFVEAVREHKVCLIGSFCTQIIHDKILFYILNTQETFNFLNQSEIEFIKAHIPYTVKLFDNEILENNVLNKKNNWLIKPKDSYGAKGIFAGVNFSVPEWRNIIAENKNKDYVLQEFVMPYQSWNIDFKIENPEFKKYSNLTGLYVYNGKMAGVYSRQSAQEIISDYYDENDIATVVLENK